MIFAEETNLLLAVTPYSTRDDIDILFANSQKTLIYLSGEDLEQPLFISLINKDQEKILTDKGFKPRILDNNTNLSRYTLLYSPQEDQFNELKNQGEIFQIAKHYAFLKSPPNKPFEHTGEAAKFFDIPFPPVVIPPPLRTKTVSTPTPSLTVKSAPISKIINEKPSNYMIFISLIILILIASGITFVLIKKKQPTNDTPKI